MDRPSAAAEGQRAERGAPGAQFDRIQFRIRLAIVVVLAGCAAALPVAGPNRYAIAAVLLLVVLPLHFVVRRLAGTPNPTGWLDLVAALSATAVAALEPQLWPACLLFQMLNVGGAIAFLTPRWTRILASAALASSALVALARPVPNPVPMLVVAVVFVPALLIGATQKKSKERRASDRVASIIESLPILVWEAEPGTGVLLNVIGRSQQLIGRRPDDLIGRPLADFVHPDDRADFQARLGEGLGDGRPTRIEYRFRHADGRWLWLSDDLEWRWVRGRRVVRGVTHDIHAERANRVGLEQRTRIVERMAAGVLVVTEPSLGTGSAVEVVSPGPAWLSTGRGESLGRRFPALVADGRVVSALASTSEGLAHRIGPMEVHAVDRSRHWVEVETVALGDGVVALIVEDVSERERANQLIRHQAYHDGLTGLANRRQLMERLATELEAGGEVALALLDLNRFKAINDTLGHLTGDALLRVIGRRMANAVGADDLVARLGGDEFAVVFRPGEPGDVERTLERIQDACRETAVIAGSPIATGVSIGVATGPHHATDGENLLRCADLAMYAAKRSRSGIRYFDPALDDSSAQLELLAELPDALARGEIVSWYQPKVELATGRVIGAEALVRWEHPELGVLAPSAFLDVVLLAGRIDELAALILWHAVEFLAGTPDEIEVAVNLSAVNLRRPGLATTIQGLLTAHGVAPGRLTVEVTESEMLDETGLLRRSLVEIAELGVGVAVDDFGTGYSSMAHLRDLPLTELKIDRSFVSELTTNEADATIVKTLISLGHALGLRICAEGIESAEILGRLRRLGCDHGQGYHLGRPVTAAELRTAVGVRGTVDADR